MFITGLHIVCVYTTHCTKCILFPIKIAISGHLILDFPFAEITIMGSHMIKTTSSDLQVEVLTSVLKAEPYNRSNHMTQSNK